MIQFSLVSSKAGNNIPEPISVSELTKGHTHELISTGKMLDSVIPGVLCYTVIKSFPGKVIHKLRKNEAS